MQLSIILPTYNEAEYIRLIVPRISDVLKDSNLKGEIIVVDDNSPDGTAEVARQLAGEYPVRVHLRTKERGLATAVIKGFDLSKGDICLVMDADLSHPVEKIQDMVTPILEGRCDATVGTRYIEGGGADDWPLIRKVISKGAGILAAGVTKLKDPTSGFMAIRRSLLESAELEPVGWKIVLEVIVKTNASYQEVPIVFGDRQKGESKLDFKVQKDYIHHLLKLYAFRFPWFVQFVRFCLVGSAGMIVDTLVLVFLVEIFSFGPKLAAVFAFLAAVSLNYSFNNVWTFRGGTDSGIRKYLSFIAVCSIGLAIRLFIMHVLIEYGGMGRGRLYILASITGILCATLFNFMGSRYIFRKTIMEQRVDT